MSSHCIACTFLLLSFFFSATSCVDPQQFMVAKFSFCQSTARDEFHRRFNLGVWKALFRGLAHHFHCFRLCYPWGMGFLLLLILWVPSPLIYGNFSLAYPCPRRAFCLNISWPLNLFFGVLLERCPEVHVLQAREHEDVYGKDRNKGEHVVLGE